MTKPLDEIAILIADDVPLNLMILKQILTTAGATVITAANGREVLETLEMETHIDVLLMDLQMPEMDGYETAQVIRYCGQAYSNIPIVAVTGETGAEEMTKCSLAGMNDFISKPFKAEVICQKVLALLLKKVTPSELEISEVALEGKPLYDLVYLKEITNGEIDKLMLIVNNLTENAPVLVSQTQASIASENWKVVIEHAHKLKGLVGLFYMPKITAALITVEEGSKAIQPDKLYIQTNMEAVATLLPELMELIMNDIKI